MASTTCDYCTEQNTEDNLLANDGIVYNADKDKHYLFIEHFRNEHYRIPVNYCPQCGRDLHLKKGMTSDESDTSDK